MRTFYTADPHFEHEGVMPMSHRVFASIEDHNDAILDGINSTVGKHDRLFMLGDIAWRGGTSWFSGIVCKNLHLIYGNHDQAKIGRLFKTAEDVAEVKIGEHYTWLSHYPHCYWPRSHYGSFHLYGHMHAAREKFLDALFPGRRSMDCGVDNAKRLLGEYRPFSEGEIIDILGKRPGHDHVEWYERKRANNLSWKEIFFPDFIAECDANWDDNEMRPDLMTILAKSNGWNPLANGESMTIHYGGRGYIIKRDDKA